jgi:Tfp pilus assembly protein PilF
MASARIQKHSEAVEVLEKGRKLVIANDELKLQFEINLAESYHRLKEYKKSDQYFESVLKMDPDNKLVLNNYSFYLTERNEKLKQAERQSKKCAGLEPNNSTYLDTYAWVLYKLEKYQEAEVQIKLAYSNGGNKNAVIIEHYGDILFKLGDEEGALEKWKEAKNTGKGSKNLDEKIKIKKLVE